MLLFKQKISIFSRGCYFQSLCLKIVSGATGYLSLVNDISILTRILGPAGSDPILGQADLDYVLNGSRSFVLSYLTRVSPSVVNDLFSRGPWKLIARSQIQSYNLMV